MSIIQLCEISQMLSARACVCDSSRSKATRSDSPEQLQLWPSHPEAPTTPTGTSLPSGEPYLNGYGTETGPGLSKRPFFYFNFPSSKSSFNFLYLLFYGTMITENVHKPAEGYHPLIKDRLTQDCQSTAKMASVKSIFLLNNLWTIEQAGLATDRSNGFQNNLHTHF